VVVRFHVLFTQTLTEKVEIRDTLESIRGWSLGGVGVVSAEL
jgi:hypothetical protein